MRVIRLIVEMHLPEQAKASDAQAYVLDAVQTWRGSLRPPGGYEELDPGDPMWGLDSETVKVKRYAKRKVRVAKQAPKG